MWRAKSETGAAGGARGGPKMGHREKQNRAITNAHWIKITLSGQTLNTSSMLAVALLSGEDDNDRTGGRGSSLSKNTTCFASPTASISRPASLRCSRLT